MQDQEIVERLERIEAAVIAPPKEYLNIKQVAEFIGVSRQTLDLWRISAEGPTVHRVGTRVLYSVSDEDAALIEIVVPAAIADCHFGIFQRDLVAACASVGWQHHDQMTLWTVALYTDIFPVCEMPREVRRYDGLIHFAGPSVALGQSTFDLFWNDRDLVCLALKRADAPDYPVRPNGQRSGLRPYQGW